jgi:hypothetical protein
MKELELQQPLSLSRDFAINQSLITELFWSNEQDNQRHIEAILIRAGNFKADWIKKILHGTNIRTEVYPSEWNEDECGLLTPTFSAACKAVCAFESLPVESKSGEGWVVNIATDVMLRDEDDKPISKPRDAQSYAEIERMLIESLAFRERIFTIQASPALYALKNGDRNSHVGLTEHEQHKMVVDPFSPAEIELYIYGIKGRIGDYPAYLQVIYDDLVKRYPSLDELETEQIRRGFTLEELKQSNMACRWPYINMQTKIREVNGISRGSDGFDTQLRNMYWALLGAPRVTKNLLLHFQNSKAVDQTDVGASIYPDLPGQWKQLVRIDNETFSISRVIPQDCEAISDMAVWNFCNATNYNYLTPEEQRGYSLANTTDGVWEVSSNEKNIGALVVKRVLDGTDQVVGWEVVRHLKGQPGFADIRRIHMDGREQLKGLGKRVLAMSEALARDAGCSVILVNASGESSGFFKKRGYRDLGEMESRTGVFSAETQPKPTVVRLVKLL